MADETTPAGATPVAAGATPAQSAPSTPAPAPPSTTDDPPPATGDAAGLGDAGKRAIDRMKAERDAAVAASKAAEAELEKLRAASLSDSEKAIAQAKKDGAIEVSAKFQAQVRRSEIRTALTAAGINPGLLELAAKADEFATLKVTDDGEVEGLAAAVATFKKAHEDVFGAPRSNGADLGAGGAGSGGLTRAQIEKMTPEEINRRWPEVSAAMAGPR